MARARSSRCLRWVTSRQKSRASCRPGHPVFGLGGTPGPQGAVRCGEFHPHRDGQLGLPADVVAERPSTHADMRDVPQPSGLLAADAEASAMSWVCAQVSISRAVCADAALMAGPNHGSLARGSSPAKVPSRSARAASNQASIRLRCGRGTGRRRCPDRCRRRPAPRRVRPGMPRGGPLSGPRPHRSRLGGRSDRRCPTRPRASACATRPRRAGHQVPGDGGLGGPGHRRARPCLSASRYLPAVAASPAAACLVLASATGRTWPALTCSPPWPPRRRRALCRSAQSSSPSR